MAVSIKMGVDVNQFRQGMQQAQQSAKTLQAQLKANEAQFQATGNKEQYMANQSKLLKAQLDAQKSAAKNAEDALKAMREQGVSETSREYQKLAQQLAAAQAQMYGTQSALNGLASGEAQAAAGAGELAQNLSTISKKVSLDAVIGGIGKVTGALESAAKKAVQTGQTIFSELMDSARWADDAATMAQMYEVPLEKYLQMEAMVKSGMDTSVDAILGSMSRMRRSVGKESAETMNTIRSLGLVTTKTLDTGFGQVEEEVRLYRDADDLFWKAGKAIMNMGDAFDKEAAAQAVFGKSWRELIPLFSEFSDEESFNEALKGMNTNTEEQVKDLAALNDAMSALEHNFDVLKNDVLAALAPALTTAADALSGLLTSITDYLATPDGKKMLDDLGTAVSGLFEDLGKIDPAQVVEGFTSVFNTIVKGMQWLVDNKDLLSGVLTTITLGWAGAKLTGGALEVMKLINGLKGLRNGGDIPLPNTTGGGTGGTRGLPVNHKTSKFKQAAIAAAGYAGEVLPFAGAGLGLTAAALTLPVITQVDVEKKILEKYSKTLEAAERAENAGLDADTLRRLNEATVNDVNDRNMFGFLNLNDTDKAAAVLQGLSDPRKRGQLYADIQRYGSDLNAGGDTLWTALLKNWGEYREWRDDDRSTQLNQEGERRVEAPLDQMAINELVAALAEVETRKLEDQQARQEADKSITDAAEKMAGLPEQVAAAVSQAPIEVTVVMDPGAPKANGMWSVPWDGYPALLHKGERIVPAREAGRYYNSNLYVENMVMNGGADAAGLAAAMAAAQRRTMAGYGN